MSQGTFPLAQNSLRMIWRCMGYWGTLTKMWKNYRKILLVWNIGEMIGNWDLTLINAKWCIFLKRMTIQALNYLCGNNLKAVSEVEDLGIHITSNLLPYHLLNADTPLIWTLSMAPSVSIEMGFDRTPCLIPRCLKCGKQKTWQHEPSRSIMQWTMGTFSMDAKDAGKDEQQKNLLFAFPMIPSIEPKSQSLLNQSEHACVRGSCIPKLWNLEEIPFTPIIKLQTVTVSHLTRTVSWNSFISLLMLCKAVLY